MANTPLARLQGDSFGASVIHHAFEHLKHNQTPPIYNSCQPSDSKTFPTPSPSTARSFQILQPFQPPLASTARRFQTLQPFPPPLPSTARSYISQNIRMKSFRLRKEGRASSDAVMKKPNLLRRFAHKAKKMFHTNHPAPSSAQASRAIIPPAQLQEATVQSSYIRHEGRVLEPAEWLSPGTLAIQVVASRKPQITRQSSPEPHFTQATSDGASSVYSQLTNGDIGIFPTPPQIPKLSDSNQIITTKKAGTESSGSLSATTHHQTETEEDITEKRHARCLESVDVGNTSFFVGQRTRNQHQQVLLSPAAPLTDSAEDFSDAFAVVFGTANGDRPDCEDRQPTCPADNRSSPTSEDFCWAQSYREVQTIRRQRVVFAARLEAELEMQKMSLETDFEKCYDTSDRLHEIDLLNLREDHEAEVETLREERDAGFAEVEKLTAQRDGFQSDVLVLTTQISGLEKLLRERTEEAEGYQRQAGSLMEDNRELVSEIDRLRQVVQACRARLLEAGHVHEVLDLQNKDLVRVNGDVCAAYEAERTEKESVQRQLVALVDEKSKDFSWHIPETRCSLELKSEDEEKAESRATAMARELHRREAEKVVKLSKELAEVRLKTEARFREEAKTNLNLSEVAQATAVALDACQHEKQELEEKYRELLTAVSVDVNVSELAKGLSGDLQVAFEERSLFSRAFMEAELQLIKSEQKRRDQACDLRDLVQEKENELADAQQQLSEAKLQISGQEFILEARDDEIRNTVPELKERIAELENILEMYAMGAGQFQANVITDLNKRNQRQMQLAKFYEHHFMQTINQLDSLKTEWGFYLSGTLDDLQLARGFRDQRDALNIECRALHERFGDELLLQPLVIPETLKTNSQIEEEQLKNMDEGVLKQLMMTYKALPKWLAEPGCPGYEQLRIDLMIPELDRQKKEREAVHQSFGTEAQDEEEVKAEQFPEDDEEEDCTF